METKGPVCSTNFAQDPLYYQRSYTATITNSHARMCTMHAQQYSLCCARNQGQQSTYQPLCMFSLFKCLKVMLNSVPNFALLAMHAGFQLPS